DVRNHAGARCHLRRSTRQRRRAGAGGRAEGGRAVSGPPASGIGDWGFVRSRLSRRAPRRVELRLHAALFLFADDPDRQLVAFRVAERAHEVLARARWLAVDRRDDVARLEARARRGRAISDRPHEHALLHAEVLRELIAEPIDLDAEPAA